MGTDMTNSVVEQFVASTLNFYPESSFPKRYGDIGSPLNVVASSEIAIALLAPFIASESAEAVFKHVMDLAAEHAPRERAQAQLLLQRAVNLDRDIPLLIADGMNDDDADEIEGPAQQLVILLVMASDPAIVSRIRAKLLDLADGPAQNDAANFVLWLLERTQEVVDAAAVERGY